MGHHRPLFELIIEESRKKARETNLSQEFTKEGAFPRKLHKAKVGWFTRGKKSIDKTSASPTKCSSDYESANESLLNLSDYGSANDSLSFNLNWIHDWQGQLGLPCLQDEGERYLEVAMALDMMELRAAQACAERDVALSQALDLRFALDSICSRLHQVEQYCQLLNHDLFLDNTRTQLL